MTVYKNGAIYSRVSTAQQEEGTSINSQVEKSLGLAAEVNCPVNEESIVREQGSGADTSRALFQKLQQRVVAGEFTHLFAYAPDRIARDPLDLLNFCRVCENAGAQIHFVVGPSGNDEYTQLIRFVNGFAGHQERAMTTRRTTAGKMAVARSGRMPNGTGKGFYGYDYNPVKKERTVNEIEANVVRRMFRDVAAGKSAYRVAVELNEEGILTKTGCKWYSISVERILENTAYFGMNYYGRTKTYKDKDGRRKTVERPKEEWVQMWGYTPAIIPESLYKLVREQIGRPTALRGPTMQYFLSGRLLCGECGTPQSGASRWGRLRKYRCKATYKTEVREKTCSASYIDADTLESLVWSEVVNALKRPEVLIRDLQQHVNGGEGKISEEIARLEKEIEALKRQELNYAKMAADPDFDVNVVKALNAPVYALRREKKREKEVLEAQWARQQDAVDIEEQILEYCQKIGENIDSVTDFDGKRELLSAFDVKVWATKETIKITANVNSECIDYIKNATTIARTSALRREYIHRLPLA